MSIIGKLRTLTTLGKGITGQLPAPVEDIDPVTQFSNWFETANNSGIFLPEALSLSTCDLNNKPTSRMVLLKSYDQRGFVFYTNYASKKARQLESNPNASMLFHWSTHQRQVRIEGTVSKVSKQTSESYFNSRGRGSKIGAWASEQSQPTENREALKQKVQHFKKKFPTDVPLPNFWGGYRLYPQRFEFWQGRTDRLHDRIVFTRRNERWETQRLNP